MWQLESWRRSGPRVDASSFCTEIAADAERHALAVDFSPDGVRIQRPVKGELPSLIQLEFEIPSVDELIWAAFTVSFDSHEVTKNGNELRTTGLKLVSAPERHKRFLRDFVFDAYHCMQPDDLFRSACYRCN